MLKIPTLKIIGYAMLLSLETSSLAVAQDASENTVSQNAESLALKAVSEPVFARQLSNELAKCHGFLYALHDNLTEEIEMGLDTIELENSISQMAQIAGYASVIVRAHHTVNIATAHTYTNSISRNERIVWNSKLDGAKDNIIIFATPHVGECVKYMPVAQWLFDGAVRTKANEQFQ